MPSSILFTIATLIWGSTFFAITLQLDKVPPAVSVVYRFAIASAVLFALCLARGERLLLPWRTQRWLLLQGFLTFGVPYVCNYEAELYVVSGLVAVLNALIVFETPLWSRLFFGTPMSPRTWSAGAVAMSGLTLLFYHSIGTAWQNIQLGGSGKFLLGVALALLATVASSAGSAIVGKIREQSTNLILTMAWSMAWGTAMVAAWALLTSQQFTPPPTPTYWMGLIYLALFGSVIAFFTYFTLINRVGPQKAVYIGVITPVLSVLLSIRLEHYRPGAIEFLGMILCLASVAWAMRAPAAKPVQPANLTKVLGTP